MVDFFDHDDQDSIEFAEYLFYNPPPGIIK